MSDINDFEDLRGAILMWIFLIAIGWFCGWVHAHKTVADECRKLGGFYVGKSNFKCTEIAPEEKKP